MKYVFKWDRWGMNLEMNNEMKLILTEKKKKTAIYFRFQFALKKKTVLSYLYKYFFLKMQHFAFTRTK